MGCQYVLTAHRVITVMLSPISKDNIRTCPLLQTWSIIQNKMFVKCVELFVFG